MMAHGIRRAIVCAFAGTAVVVLSPVSRGWGQDVSPGLTASIAARQQQATRPSLPGAIRRVDSPLARVQGPGAKKQRDRWEVDIHVGGLTAGALAGSSAGLPAPGASFLTYWGTPSRRVSSWYFGDGAQLLNQVVDRMATLDYSGLSHLSSLDSTLTSAIAERRTGVVVGGRIARVLTPRWSVEGSVEYSSGHLAIRQTALEAIEAARASYVTAWQGFLRTGPFSNVKVTSLTNPTPSAGRQVFTTVAVVLNLAANRRMVPFVTGGAGLISTLGTMPSVTLIGNTSAQMWSSAPMNETDTMTLRLDGPKAALIALVGGGVKYALRSRWGLRLDLRAYMAKNRIGTLIDANPKVVLATPEGVAATLTVPALQFSNTARFGDQSSLSGPALSGVRTFSGGGTATHVTVTTGLFWRF